MDAKEIKFKIGKNICNENLICGKSLKWAAGNSNLLTFVYYYEKQKKGSNAFPWNEITLYAIKHKNLDVIDFLKKANKYSIEKKEDILEFYENKNDELKLPDTIVGSEKFKKIHYKSKNLKDMKKVFENVNYIFQTEEICILTLNCAIHGSLDSIKFIYASVKSMSYLILVNALRGAIASYYPEIIAWCESLLGVKLSDINPEIVKEFIFICPSEELRNIFCKNYK